MSYDPRDDVLDPAPSFPAYDPYQTVLIGTVYEDEPECHGYCHCSICSVYAPCQCEADDCEACKP